MDINSALNNQHNIMMLIEIFTFGFIGLITLIGISNVFNTISTSVRLRKKELAMLKSIGITPNSFNRMMNFESFFYGLKALLYGLPISFVICVVLYYNFIRQFVFNFTLPWINILGCILGVFAIVFGTMVYASIKIRKENIIDALISDIT